MNCIYEAQIADYVDEALDQQARAAFASHLPGCEACSVMVTDFRSILTATATLERHPVPPQVWARIATAIESDGQARPWWQSIVIPPVMLWKPLAAGGFVLLLGILTWSGVRQLDARRHPVTAPETAAALANAGMSTGTDELSETVDTDLSLAAAHYEKAIAGLQRITTARSAELDAATSAVLQTNLSVIDHAISESRTALTTQPTSLPAQESLFEALRSKVALLQDTVTLINEIPKDNQEGNASGVNQ